MDTSIVKKYEWEVVADSFTLQALAEALNRVSIKTIGPFLEMARIAREFRCGVVADDFAPTTLARALNRLTAADFGRMKSGSEKAAHVYTAENYTEKVGEIVASVPKEF